MNNNLINALESIRGYSISSVAFDALTNALSEKVTESSLTELISLPMMKHEYSQRCNLALSAFEDGYIFDCLVRDFCHCITEIPYQVREYSDRLSALVKLSIFSLNQLLTFANAFEPLYAAGFEDTREMILGLYRIAVGKEDSFNPFSYEKVKCELACIAYSCLEYNYPEKISALRSIHSQIKRSEAGGLKGIVHYYKGLCKRYSAECEVNKHMLKAANCGEPLASVYLNHSHSKNKYESTKMPYLMDPSENLASHFGLAYN